MTLDLTMGRTAAYLLIVALAWQVQEGSACFCGASGDPHYRTFDGRTFDFMGTCKYVLSQPKTRSECFFVIGAQNSDPMNRNPPFLTSTVTVDIVMFGNSFQLARGGVVLVNGRRVKSVTEGIKAQVVRSGVWTVFSSIQCGVRVQFDGNSVVQVILNRPRWRGQLQGLCGDCNGNPKDDFRDRAGRIVAGPIPFGNSWLLTDDRAVRKANCIVPAQNQVVDQCPAGWSNRVQGPQWCGALANRAGPFAACMNRAGVVNWEFRFGSCRFDVCSLVAVGNPASGKNAACDIMAATAAACAQAGISGIQWRVAADCKLPCPANQIYRDSVEACPSSCAILRNGVPRACANMPRSEGCHCAPGFVRFGVNCVSPTICPPERELDLFGGDGPGGNLLPPQTLLEQLPWANQRPADALHPIEMSLVNQGVVPTNDGTVACFGAGAVAG